MSSEQQLTTTSDFRSATQDYKRDAEAKHKWALGTKYVRGRGAGNPRPWRASDSGPVHRRWERVDAVQAEGMNKAKLARKHEMLSAGDDAGSEDSNTSAEEDVDTEATAPDAGAMYSFDAGRSPTLGSQILNTALAKAIEKYEDKETTKLVRTEYEVLDADADEEDALGLTRSKGSGLAKGKGEVLDAEDEEYEFV